MAGEGFGIGKYITELADALLLRNSANFEYVLIFDRKFSRKQYEKYRSSGRQCELIDARYYSFQEQARLPGKLMSYGLDLAHFPNFNAPVLYPGNIVLTIHDLIHHRFPGVKKRNILYRWGYRTAIKAASMRAKKIIAVSESTKSDIIKMLHTKTDKISVIYEGVNPDFQPANEQTDPAEVLSKYGITKPYILFVGVWRKYKNLPLLSDAYRKMRDTSSHGAQLVLLGDADPHYPEIRTQVLRNKYSSDIIAPGKVPENDLIIAYQNASCLVNPSLYEGFGLTGLEAQACGTPVLSSDITVAHEILNGSAAYFDPVIATPLADLLKKILSDDQFRHKLSRLGLENSKKYTWAKTAERTEQLYESVLKNL